MKSQYDANSYYQPQDIGQRRAGYELEPRLALRENEAPSRRWRSPAEPHELIVGALVLAQMRRYDG